MNIKRDYYLNKLIKKMNNNRVKIITGIRRSGKSFLLFEIFKNYLLDNGINKNNIITLTLDDVENIKYRNPLFLNEYIKTQIKNENEKYYIFIDEIQFCKSVDNPYIENDNKSITFVDVLLGLMKNKNLDLYITGSNSKMLSKDILTQFRDRGDEIYVSSLTFSEILPLFNEKREAMDNYFIYGGLPYIYTLENEEEKSKYLKDIFNITYIKDIMERYKINNEKEIIDILLDLISSSIGSLINPSKLSNRYKSEKKINISSNTISNYLNYLEEAYLIYSVNRYDIKGSKYFSTPLKFYFSDIGLRNARINFRQIEKNHIMENIIYNELKFRGFNIDIGVVEYEIKENDKRKKQQLEIDFIINKADKKYYIQSALNIDTIEKKEQEIRSLKKTGDNFKKIVIIKEYMKPRYDENGILYICLEDFLLKENSIDI